MTKILIGLVIALSLLFLAYPNATFAADSDEKQSVTIQATKLFKGGTLTGGDFTYKLTPTSYTGTTLTTTNDAEGNIKFTVEYTDDDIKWEDDTTKETGYLIYKMQEVKGNNNSIRYDDNECYAVVKVERTEMGIQARVSAKKYEIKYIMSIWEELFKNKLK